MNAQEKVNFIVDRLNSPEDKAFDVLVYLYERWQDEKEYEDIGEYLQVIKQYIPEATKMYKRPFGVACEVADGVFLHVSIQRSGNRLAMRYAVKVASKRK